ncbi:MAG: VWA domain-containing protein [Pirellulaceae bacterium]
MGWDIDFDSPVYLWLGLLAPLLWLFSLRSLAGLGRFRWMLANMIRTLVFLAMVLALAEIQLLRSSDKITVIYLLDQSASIPLEKRQAMLEYAVQEVDEHRNRERQDRAGVIVFGRNASIEVPPFDDDIVAMGGVDSYLDLRADATNLEAALKLAKASFPEDSSKRIVIVTDGNENIGDARSLATSLIEDGIGMDVVPVRLESRAEIAVEKVTLPADIRKGQPIETRVVLHNYAEEVIHGKVRVTRRAGRQEEFLGEKEVALAPGKNVFAFDHTIEQPAVYTYQADFVPLDPEDDLMAQNNRATAFTHVRGKGRVLFIEDWKNRGEFNYLIERLKNNNIEITVQSSDQLFTSLAELQGYDAVVLANVPRSSGDDADSVTSFSEEQVEMLVHNTELRGCGLVMLGGRDSFGAGGWSNTELEKAMPVDFQIKNSKIKAVGALALMMHASEMADGNRWQKEVAEQAIKALGPMDYCGLIHWTGGGDAWLWKHPQGIVRVGRSRNMMLSRLGRMTPGDMPQFDPAMRMALASFRRVNASVKLMIVISDGDPSQPSATTVAGYKSAGIQVTAVAVGAHGPAGHKTLQDLADATGGRYYVVKNARALPKIYVAEVRRVARPLIYEPKAPVQPETRYCEVLEGIHGPLPPISGFVLTTVKENALVEVGAISPRPADERNATILATWTYGLGRTAVLTTDAGNRWASRWKEWENYDKFFTQLLRWSMRPVDDQGNFSVATNVRDGWVRVVITALDKEDEFLNFLNMSALAIDPDLESFDIRVRQVAPGRYVGEFEAPKEGNYFLTMSPGPGHAPLLTGVNVPYSAEFRDRDTNRALLTALARRRPQGGEPGMVIDGELDKEDLASLLRVNTFRRGLAPAISSQHVWPLALVFTACLFFADVFVRRVTIGFEWLGPALQRVRTTLFRQTHPPEVEDRLEGLRSRKAAIGEQIDERRAAARFEPTADPAVPEGDPRDVLGEATEQLGAARRKKTADPPLRPEESDEVSYTERLLKAKKQAWKEPDESGGA